MANRRKRIFAILKLLVSAVLVYFILTKINLGDVTGILTSANLGWFSVALLAFIFSKYLAALRLNMYFDAIGVPLTQNSNLQLYLLGMFYNLFLPGGIGGDAYKAYLLKKEFSIEAKKGIAALFVDRLSGMLLLLLYACILMLFLTNFIPWIPAWSIILIIPLGILGFYILNKLLFKTFLPIFWASFGLSAGVQLLQLASAWCLLNALGTSHDYVAYLFVFLVSSLVSIIPLTLGGIGARELTFFYGAQWLSLDEVASIGVSMTFFLITALVSLLGIIYHFKRPKLEMVSPRSG